MKTFKICFFLIFLVFNNFSIYAQGIAINTTGDLPHASAILDISTTDKGLLIPRMNTAQRDAILNPANALLIQNTDNKCIEAYINGTWECIAKLPCNITTPVAGAHVRDWSSITWNWNAVSGALGYKYNTTLDLSTAIDLGNITSYTQTGLSCGGVSYTVYVWAYDDCGITSPQILTTTTLNTVTDIDNNSYPIKLIGTQCWMTKNLNVTKAPNGTSISRVCYNGVSSNCTTYGGLYLWATLMNGANSSNSNPSNVQGICPNGWHVPSNEEWKQLEMHLGMSLSTANLTSNWRETDNEGGKMKQTGTTYWTSPNNYATNESGFNVLPGGYMEQNNPYNINNRAYFSCATQYNTTQFYYRMLDYQYGSIFLSISGNKSLHYMSVRCLKD